MNSDTTISEILAYILAAVLIGYSVRTPAFFVDETSWITLGAAMGFALVGQVIRYFSSRDQTPEGKPDTL